VFLAVMSVVGGLAVTGDPAMAAWQVTSDRTAGRVTASEMPAVVRPAVSVSGRDVTVTWSAATFASGVPVEAYEVTRSEQGTGVSADVGSACSGTVKTVSCLERGVPAGSWEYRVRARHGAWTGPASPPSDPVTVSGATTRTLTTTAFKVADLSGTTAVDASSPYAFAGDGRTAAVATGTTFRTTAYLELDYADAVPAGAPPSNASFNLSLAPGGAGTACMYFEVRLRSTGQVLATHGSRTAPVTCSQTARSTTTPLPEVTTAATAGDLRIRVYTTNSAAAANSIDLATVSASTTAKPSFALYASRSAVANGAAPAVSPWPLSTAGDGAALTTASGWGRAFDPARRLELTFPDYVPDTATSVGATLSHAYRSATAKSRTCWYFEVYSRGLLLAAHGSPAAPVSCSQGTAFQADTVALPEVDTAAEAGSVTVRVYAKSSGPLASRRTSEHDLSTVTFSYAG
jgi:hypothetical protein